MKNILYLLIVFCLASCQNNIKNSHPQKAIFLDTVAVREPHQIKYDSIVKISKPFELNSVWFYWENYIINGSEVKINLKNYKSKKTLISESFYVDELLVDITSDEYFDVINAEFFEDLNFDGYKDFYFYYKGSMAMTSSTGIFLFNNESKTFEISEYLSANSIEEVDSNARKLVTSNYEMDYEIINTHYFDKFGKIKYSEVITNHSNPTEYKVYEKIVNGKIVERKVDSTSSK